MAENMDFILRPRLEGYGYDDKDLKNDLERLTNLINKKGGLKLKLSIDSSDSNILKEVEKQIEDVTKKIAAKLESIQKSGIGQIKIGDISGLSDIKALENMSAQANVVVKDILSIIEAVNRLSSVDVKADIGSKLGIDNIQNRLVETQRLIEAVTSRMNEIKPTQGLGDVNTQNLKPDTQVVVSELDKIKAAYEEFFNSLDKASQTKAKTAMTVYAKQFSDKDSAKKLVQEDYDEVFRRINDVKFGGLGRFGDTLVPFVKQWREAKVAIDSTADSISKVANLAQTPTVAPASNSEVNTNALKAETQATQQLVEARDKLASQAPQTKPATDLSDKLNSEKASLNELNSKFKEHQDAVKTAQEIESGKVKTSQDLSNALIAEGKAAETAGKQHENAERAATSRTGNSDSTFTPIIAAGGVKFNPKSGADLEAQLRQYLDKVSSDLGFTTTDLKINFDKDNEATRAIATFKNGAGDVVKEIYGINAALDQAKEGAKELTYLGGEFKKSFEIKGDLNDAFLVRLKSSLKDVEHKAFDASKSLKNTASQEEMLAAISSFDDKVKQITAGSVGEYSRTVKAELGEVVREIDRVRKALQQKEYPGIKLAPDAFGESKLNALSKFDTYFSDQKVLKLLTDENKAAVDKLRESIANADNDASLKKSIGEFNRFKDVIRQTKNEVASEEGAYKNTLSSLKELYAYKTKYLNLTNKTPADDLLYGAKIDQTNKSYADLKSQITDPNQLLNIRITEIELENQYKRALEKSADAMMRQNTELQALSETKLKDMSLDVERLTGKFGSVNQDLVDSAKYNEAKISVDNLKKSLDDLLSMNGKIGQDDAVKVYAENLKYAKKLVDELHVPTQRANAIDPDVLKSQLRGLGLTMDDMKRKWSEMVSDPQLMRQWESLSAKIRAALAETDVVKAANAYKSLSLEVGNFKKQVSAADKNQRSFADSINTTGKRLAAYLASMVQYRLVFGSIRNGFKAIKDVNNAMAELKMVTDATGESYHEFLKSATVSAVKLGASIDSVIKSTTSFVRLGFDFTDSAKLAEIATILSTVGQMDIGSATEAIVSQMKAFNVEAEKAMRIVDLLTVSDSKFSVTASGVAEAMKRSSAALTSANNSMEESVGLVNAVNAVLQDPEKSGTVLTRVATRLRNTSGALAEMGESTDDTFESITQLQEKIYELTNKKVNIFADKDTFKSTYQILDEISREWENLTDKQRADISRIASGIQGAQGFSALMVNFQDARDSIEEFESASGDALAKNAEMMDSNAKKSEQLKANFQSLATGLLDGGVVNTFVDMTSWMLQAFSAGNSLLGKLLLIPVAISAITAGAKTLAGLSIVKAITNVGTVSTNLTAYTKSLNILKQFTDNYGASIAQLGAQFESMNGRQQASVLMKIMNSNADKAQKQAAVDYLIALKTTDEAERNNIKTKLQAASARQANSQSIRNEETALIASLGGKTAAAVSATMITGAITGIFTAVNSYNVAKQAKEGGSWLGSLFSGAFAGAMAGMAFGWQGMLIGAGVGATVSGVSSIAGHYAGASKRAVDAANELTQAFDTQKKAISDNISTLRNLKEEFDVLSRGVSTYGDNVSLSTDKYRRYREIVEQIVGITPGLRVAFDEEGKSIAAKNNLIERSIELLEEENKRKAEEMVSPKALNIVYGKVKTDYNAVVDDFYNKGSLQSIEASRGLSAAFEDIIGEPLGAGGLLEYISDYSDQIRNSLDEIKTHLMQGYDGVAGISEFEALRTVDYLREKLEGIKKIENASKQLNPTLQLVPQTLTAYGEMSAAQKSFVSQYINGFSITSRTTEREMKAMVDRIKEFVDIFDNENDKSIAELIFDDKNIEKPMSEYRKTLLENINALSEDTKNKLVEKNAQMSPEEWNMQILIKLGFDVDYGPLEDLLKQNGRYVDGMFDVFSQEDINLINNAPQGFGFGDSLDEMTRQLENYKVYLSEVTEEAQDFSAILEKTKDVYTLLGKAQKDLNDAGQISVETLEGISSKFPELNSAVLEYISGSISAAEVVDILNKKIAENGIISEATFNQVLLNSNNVSDGLKNGFAQAFTAIGAGWDSTRTIMANLNNQIITANGTATQTFQQQWQGAIANTGAAISTLAEGMSNLLLGNFYSDTNPFGVYRNDEGAVHSKDLSGAQVDLIANMKYKLLDDSAKAGVIMSDEDAYQKAYETINAQYDAALNRKNALDNQRVAFEEKLKNLYTKSAGGGGTSGSSSPSSGADYDEKYTREYLSEVNKIENAIKRQNDLLDIQKESNDSLIDQQNSLNVLSELHSQKQQALNKAADDMRAKQGEVYSELAKYGFDPTASEDTKASVYNNLGKENKKIVKDLEKDYQELDKSIVSAGSDWFTSEKAKYDIWGQRHSAFSEYLSSTQHQIDLLRSQDEFLGVNDTAEKQIELYAKMRADVQEQANWYRTQGLSDENKYVKELGILWYQYAEEEKQLLKSIFDTRTQNIEHENYLVEKNKSDLMGEQRIANLKEAQAQAQQLADHLRNLGYAETSESIKELQSLWWKWHDEIVAIYEDVAVKYKENIDRMINAQTSLLQQLKALKEFQKGNIDISYDAGDRKIVFDDYSKTLNDAVWESIQQQRNAGNLANEQRGAWAQLVSEMGFGQEFSLDDFFTVQGETVGQVDAMLKKIEDTFGASSAQLTIFEKLIHSAGEAKRLWYAEDQFQKTSINELRSLLEQFENEREEAIDIIISMIEKRKEADLKAIDEIHNREKKYLEERRKIIEDTFKLQLNLLDDLKQEEDYQRSLQKETDELTRIQLEIDSYSMIDTQAARTRVSELTEELNKQRDKINEMQRDKEYEDKKKALEDDEEMLLEKLDEKVKAEDTAYEEIKKAMDERYSEEAMREEALEALRTGKLNAYVENSATAYEDIATYGENSAKTLSEAFEEFTKKAGGATDTLAYKVKDGLINSFEELTDIIKKAAVEYEAYANKTKTAYQSSNTPPPSAPAPSNTGTDAQTPTGGGYYEPTSTFEALNIELMKSNSEEYKKLANEGADTEKLNSLHNANKVLAPTGAVYNAATGRWYKNNKPLYHDGKIPPYLKPYEEEAILKTDEVVLTRNQTQNLLSKLSKVNLFEQLTGMMQNAVNLKTPQYAGTSNRGDIILNLNISGNPDKNVVQQIEFAGRDLLKRLQNAVDKS